ncbi:MAG: hypothetical protein HOC74_28580 [Gemmatimonadetes bacterium]|jgi:hypothetical protein|nr:hypothetical protein [Gemmatimonadota bacterium]
MPEFSVAATGEIVFLIFFFLSAFLVIHACLNLIAHHGNLKLRMAEVNAEIDLLRPHIPEKRERVTELKTGLPALKRQRQKMADYYRKLVNLLNEAEEQQKEDEGKEGKEKEQEKGAKLRTEIRLHQLDLDWENE